MDSELSALSVAVGQSLVSRKLMLACAESCTGGWISEVITATAGSSGWFERGFVTYSNAAKQEMLGVKDETLTIWGAVSEEAARAMAQGALANSAAQVALAVTGIAGPGGGSPGKPVGAVCFAWCREGQAAVSEMRHFTGDRVAIRRQTVIHSLLGLLALLDGAKTVP
ncbi:MAG: nicotinamide-nucleotide amidohydrolase family protein [Proteobacteria bacterium]|nr:nicotinamide-nucleotide amidohydrolase family protein [Pseudomonadota bacterium]